MLPDFPDINSIEDFTGWSALLASVAGFTGDNNLLSLFNTDPNAITVGQYLGLLDTAEASLTATDFSYLTALLPTLEAQIRAALGDAPLPDGASVDDIVNASLGFLTDLAAGDVSFITDSFATIRELLADVPPETLLFEGLLFGDGPGLPDISDLFDLPNLPGLPTFGWVAGDPHLQTLDGVGYDFQAAGEFVLLQSAGAGGFMLQARMVPVGTDISINQAIATNLDGTAVMVDAADATPLHIAGVATALADGESVAVGNGRVFRDGDTYVIVYPGADGVVNDGDSQVLIRVVNDRVDLDVRLNAELLGTLEGLLGDGDGNAANDVALADGTVLARPFTFADLYGTYRDDWRVDSAGESLFTYDAGESLAGFYDPTMPGALVSLDTLDPTVRANAEAAAQAAGLTPGTEIYDNAVLDFALTGDNSFLQSALQVPLALIGTNVAETLIGGEGDDLIDGLGGIDSIEGRGGNDIINGGASSDLINAGTGHDVVNAGFGFDTVNSGEGDDHVLGLNGADQLNGENGNDTLEGNFGNDILNGGDGNDELQGGLGFDFLFGDGGDDLLVGRDGFDTLEGGAGNDTLQGNAGNDSLMGDGGDDDLQGGIGADTLRGGDDNDTLSGGNGFDDLNGNEGDDRLLGNAGNDTIDGCGGNDVLIGGLGADTFIYYDGVDRIADMQPVDTVEISADLLGMSTDLADYASLNSDGFVVLDFGMGNSLTFTNVTEFSSIENDLILV